MCTFKFNINDEVFVKERCGDIPLGSLVSITGKYDKESSPYYNVLFDNADNGITYKGVREDSISDRPPFETLYTVRVEMYNPNKYKDYESDIKTFDYIAGNLDLAIEVFNSKVDMCLDMTDRRKFYGKCVLYKPTIYNSGKFSEFADEENIIKQRFFFARG